MLLGAAALVAATIGAVRALRRRRDRRADQDWERTEAPFWAALRDDVEGCDGFLGEAEAA
jgi:hypothetical protein